MMTKACRVKCNGKEEQMMKQSNVNISAFLAAGLLISACTMDKFCQAEDHRDTRSGLLTVNVESEMESRAVEHYLEVKDYEKAIKTLRVLVFDNLGNLVENRDCGTTSTGQAFELPYGTYKVYAVANGPDLSSVTSESGLLAVSTDFKNNSKTAGFIMVGNSSVNLNSASNTANIAISRLLARVSLVSISNMLPESYSSITIENVFLANVVGNCNLAGAKSGSLWYNKEGRKDESPRVESHIIDGSSYLASVPELTFSSQGLNLACSSSTDFSASPVLLYAYPNSASESPSGFHSTFTDQKTALVVCVKVAGQKYYYPIVLDSVQANRNYTVALTFKALGTTDPGNEIKKGSLTANITVNGWGEGSIYNETI